MNSLHIRRDLFIILLLVIVSALPFLNRAIHLDENTYLSIAHNVPTHFWFPQDFKGMWFGIPFLSLGGHSHPVGIAYYLAFLLELFHRADVWKLRLGFLIFPILYGMAAYFLSRRFIRHPLAGTLLMAATPAVVVFSPTLMPDLAMTSFWLLAAAIFLAAEEDGRLWKLALVCLSLMAATLISYQAIFMGGVLAIYAMGRRERRPSFYLSLVLPVAFLAAYWTAGWVHFGYWQAGRIVHYLKMADLLSLSYFQQKILGMLSTLGATMIFFPFLLWIHFRSVKRWVSALTVSLALASCALVPRDYSIVELVEYFLFAAAGIAILFWAGETLNRSVKGIIHGDRQSAAGLMLSVWTLGVVVYTIVLCEFSATRYIVAIVVPVAILFVQRVEEIYRERDRLRKRIIWVAVFVTWAVAFMVAFADYQYVNSFRDFSRWFAVKYDTDRGRTWVGTEAGLRYYMEKIGARTLVNGYSPDVPGTTVSPAEGEAEFGRPQLNDLIVRPERFLRYDVAPEVELSARIDSRTLQSRFPLRTYSPEAHAGLHGTNVGLLPFTLSTTPLDRIEIYRYNLFAASFDEAARQADPQGEVKVSHVMIRGARKGVIAMPLPARLQYVMTIPPNSNLTGRFGVDDDFPVRPACRPRLTIALQSQTGAGEVDCGPVLVDLNDKYSNSSSRIKDFSCSATALGGQRVSITFTTGGGDKGQCPAAGLWDLQWVSEAMKK